MSVEQQIHDLDLTITDWVWKLQHPEENQLELVLKASDNALYLTKKRGEQQERKTSTVG